MGKRIEAFIGSLLSVVAIVIAVHFWSTKHVLEVLPREQDFGTIRAGETASRSYKLMNYTNRTVDIFSVGGG